MINLFAGLVFLVIILMRRIIFSRIFSSSYKASILVEAGLALAVLAGGLVVALAASRQILGGSELIANMVLLAFVLSFLTAMTGMAYEIRWNLLKL